MVINLITAFDFVVRKKKAFFIKSLIKEITTICKIYNIIKNPGTLINKSINKKAKTV